MKSKTMFFGLTIALCMGFSYQVSFADDSVVTKQKPSVAKHHQKKSKQVVAEVSNSSSELPTSIIPQDKTYIDSLDVSPAMKKLLYLYDMTPEGQADLLQTTKPSIVGPTGSTLNTPSALGGGWGMLAAGLTGVDHWPTGNKVDGSGSLTVGFGDPNKYVGLMVSALIDSINVFDHRVAENGTIAAQLSRNFSNNYALAVGISNLIPWGTFTSSSKNYFAVGTKIFATSIKSYPLPLTVSLGAGTGGFYSVAEANIKSDNKVLPFGSVGWRILPRLSLISDWSANQLNAGISIVPIASWPIIINFADCNLNRHQGTRSYLMGSVGIGYNFLAKKY